MEKYTKEVGCQIKCKVTDNCTQMLENLYIEGSGNKINHMGRELSLTTNLSIFLVMPNQVLWLRILMI